MTQQPAMPSRHVCQVKYRKVGLEQGEGGHPLPCGPHASCRASTAIRKAVPRCQPATPSEPRCASPGHVGHPICLQERAERGDGTSQGTGQPLAASPWQTGVVMAMGLWLPWHSPGGGGAGSVTGSVWQCQQPRRLLSLVQGGGGGEARSCYFL